MPYVNQKRVIMKKLTILVLLAAFAISAFAQQRQAAAPAGQLILIPAIAMGLILGIYEFLLLSRDVQIGGHKFTHGITAILICIAGSVFSFNVPLVFALVPQLKSIPLLGTEIGVRVLLGIILAAKVHGASQALKGAGLNVPGAGETWFHSLLIGGLVAGGPFLFPFAKPLLPKFLQG